VHGATCGHQPPRRVCDLCSGERGAVPFLACSLACLKAHQAAEHAEAPAESAARAAAYQARVNSNVANNREWYAGHRARVTELILAVAKGGELAVLGAGNGSDLDLPALAARFASLHLVDIDGEALERCRGGAPASIREKLVLHPEIDLSGFGDRIDEWGDAFPAAAELGAAAQPAIGRVLRALGRPFDVVVSTCALSQLAVPYHRAWILPASDWTNLHAAVAAVHLATIVGATKPGGTGILVFDVLSSRTAPALRDVGGAPEDSAAFVERHEASGGQLDPSPAGLLARLGGMGRLVEDARLLGPWTWNIGAETQLVYAIAFSRA
jgi:hypothetical protein